MKFIHYIETISGVSIYGLVSLVLFAGIFLIMLLWSVKADGGLIEEMRKIPLE